MKYEEFMGHIERYYGKYREGTDAGSYVLRYLKTDIKQEKLPALLETVMRYCWLSDYAPGIGEIEHAIRKSSEDGDKGYKISKRVKGEADRIEQHKQHVMSLPEEDRLEFANEGDLFRAILDHSIQE